MISVFHVLTYAQKRLEIGFRFLLYHHLILRIQLHTDIQLSGKHDGGSFKRKPASRKAAKA